ncbi:MAG TPA: ferredoxin--NADP reductase, partial [Solimonas sp.]|nr:ferredoxin--NADP reductase [Solimonas sp.]
HDYITEELPHHEFLGDLVRNQLIYYPSVTREPFKYQGRITDLIENGKMCRDIGLPDLNPETDRVMICGSPSLLTDLCAVLDKRGFEISPHIGTPGDYVIERAFVEK